MALFEKNYYTMWHPLLFIYGVHRLHKTLCGGICLCNSLEAILAQYGLNFCHLFYCTRHCMF